MQRLTEKINGRWQTNGKANIDYIDTNESVFVGKAIDKLAEFEDFMEEFGCINLKELECLFGYYKNNNYINKIEFVTYQDAYKKYKNESLILKNNWQELRKYVEKYADNFDEVIASVCDLILMKMQELEKDD